MDLNPKAVTTVHPQDFRWLYSDHGVFQRAQGATIAVASIASVAQKAKHWPDGYVKPGTLMALYTSGTYDNYWAPWVQDESPDTGLTVIGGVVLSGFLIREYADGTTSAYVTGSIYPAKMPLQVHVSKLPPLLNDAGTNRAVVAGDLPAAWQNMD